MECYSSDRTFKSSRIAQAQICTSLLARLYCDTPMRPLMDCRFKSQYVRISLLMPMICFFLVLRMEPTDRAGYSTALDEDRARYDAPHDITSRVFPSNTDSRHRATFASRLMLRGDIMIAVTVSLGRTCRPLVTQLFPFIAAKAMGHEHSFTFHDSKVIAKCGLRIITISLIIKD